MDFEITVSPRGESAVADDATICINHSQSCVARATQCVETLQAQSCIERSTSCDQPINRATLAADTGDQLSPLDD